MSDNILRIAQHLEGIENGLVQQLEKLTNVLCLHYEEQMEHRMILIQMADKLHGIDYELKRLADHHDGYS